MNKYLNFFKQKKVVITGHTGFKGAWLCLILNLFGAKVIGISLYEMGNNSIYKLLNIKLKISKDLRIDINDYTKVKAAISKIKPDLIFHLAAQPLVSLSVLNPLNTLKTNIIGTANILESLKYLKNKCSAIIITSDKCYRNFELKRGYKENDILGGSDPYSASKSAAENIFYSYFNTYFNNSSNIKIATARAGNVIGGGDFSNDRIIPDIFRSLFNNKKLIIRKPNSTRPWQHVLEPLRGYLDLSIDIHEGRVDSGNSFNFGPNSKENFSVIDIVKIIQKKIPKLKYKIDQNSSRFKESGLLKLNCQKAKKVLNWKPKLSTLQSINLTVDWYMSFINNKKNIKEITFNQINNYFE